MWAKHRRSATWWSRDSPPKHVGKGERGRRQVGGAGRSEGEQAYGAADRRVELLSNTPRTRSFLPTVAFPSEPIRVPRQNTFQGRSTRPPAGVHPRV